MDNMITENEFIRREIAIWGEDEIFDLIESGYVPVLTNRGYKWLLDSDRVDTAENLCYVSGTDSLRRVTPVAHVGTSGIGIMGD